MNALNKGVTMNMKTPKQGVQRYTTILRISHPISIFWYVFYAFLHPRHGKIATAVCFDVEIYLSQKVSLFVY